MRRCEISLAALLAAVCLSTSLSADVISTFDSAVVAAFQSGRTVLGFDEFNIGSPYYMPLPPDTYLPLGIRITANADGSTETHVCRLPQMGHFGPTHSPPNIIGGGVSASGPQWRQSVRFDFPGASGAAIGAHSDWSGANTTLSAYAEDGSLIEESTGNQGTFMAVIAPGIHHAVWRWNYDQGAAGFSLDNVTFSLAPTGCPGDMDCDGDVDFFDIDPLVLAFQGEVAYLAQFPTCRWLNGDCDGDDDVDFFDIDPFVGLLGTVCP